jgi:hypothetical protein
MTARTRQLRQDNQDGTTTAVERGYLGQDIQLRQGHSDKTAGTGHPGKDSRDRAVSTGRPDRQNGQVSLERTKKTVPPGHDSNVRRAVANMAWAGQLEQEDSRDRTDESGQDVLDRASGTGQLGQDSRDRSG